MDKDKIFSTYIDTDIASLYPKRCYIPYKDMYELERIRKTMKEGTRVTFIGSSPKFFGKIGTVVGVKIEHDYGSCPIATVEVVLDDIPGRFGFDPNALALVDASKLEDSKHDVEMTQKAYKMISTCIVKVIFNDPATIVFWGDGTKTVVKAVNEPFDPEKGLAMAIAKYHFGNKGNYYNVFRKWLPKEEEKEPNDAVSALQNFIDSISNFGKGE